MFVFFEQWNRDDIAVIKSIPNGAYSSTIGGWRVPLDLAVGRQLKKAYGDRLVMSPALKAWARNARRQERGARKLALTHDLPLDRLAIAETRPRLAGYLRGYQRAGVAAMAGQSMINGDDMGLGKTVTTIAALAEQNIDVGWNLIVAPKSSIETVWYDEACKWVDYLRGRVFTFSGDVTPHQRHKRLHDYNVCRQASKPAWLVMTAPAFRQMAPMFITARTQFDSFVVDEFHLTGLTSGSTKKDQGSQFFQLAMKIQATRRYGLSGTPIGGKPLRLWSTLHWIAPDVFRSKWQWAKTWLEIIETPFGSDFGGIREDKEEAFFTYHAPYLLRRKKEEVAPELPPKQRIIVRCDMRPKQRKQYRDFAREMEIRIDNEQIVATNKLTELTYLRAFASAECSAERKPNGAVRLSPRVDLGGKWEPLLERLKEAGIGEDGKVAVVSSSFRSIAQSAYFALSKHYNCGLIAGGVSAAKRGTAIRSFQKGELDIMVMTTQAGGVAITLDRADHVHILDESWNPDHQNQLEDRLLRISRIHQVTCYYYRTRGTIEEEVNQTTTEKNLTNEQLLDKVRQSLKRRAR
jgi:SNF2 family DNA or RNA helicase